MRNHIVLPATRARIIAVATIALIAVFTVTWSQVGLAKTKSSNMGNQGREVHSEGAKPEGAEDVPVNYAQATYIGEKACLECHAHVDEHISNTAHAKAFRFNPRNQQEKRVCEACHGPGSEHAKKTWDTSLLIGFTRSWGTPVAVQNKQCLSCHQGGQRLLWVQSTHDTNKVACSDCHNPMARNSNTGSLRKASINETCYACHPQQQADFRKRSHMPLPEGKMSCEDCHNPHGSATKPLLKADSINEVCYPCHAEKRGPFLWEHAPVRENCANCHLPHGSNQDKLLVAARPYLCQQCHLPSVGHPSTYFNSSQSAQANLSGGTPNVRVMNRSCQECHSQIHGSNHPSGARWQR